MILSIKANVIRDSDWEPKFGGANKMLGSWILCDFVHTYNVKVNLFILGNQKKNNIG